MVHTVLLALILVASVVAPMIVYLRLRAQQRAETERLIARMEEALGSSVKLLEVRTYYDQMSAEYKKMLDEAFREGNRFRQDHIRRLIERLEQVKARTLNRTVRMLDQPEGGPEAGLPSAPPSRRAPAPSARRPAAERALGAAGLYAAQAARPAAAAEAAGAGVNGERRIGDC